jgi:hypothetical protein
MYNNFDPFLLLLKRREMAQGLPTSDCYASVFDLNLALSQPTANLIIP